MVKILCIFHKSCADGFASAWAVRKLLGLDVEFHAASYGDKPPIGKMIEREPNPRSPNAIVGRDILIGDFSYPLPVLRVMAAEARSVLVIDHHATAQADLTGLYEPMNWRHWINCPDAMDGGSARDGRAAPANLAAIFDMNRGGAGLTWDYLSGGQPRPRIIDLVEDRDLWHFKHDPDTRRFAAVAASWGYEPTPENFARWDYWHRSTEHHAVISGSIEGNTGHETVWELLLNEGATILRAEHHLCESIVGGTRRTMRIAGYVVPVACCPGVLVDEVGNALCHPPCKCTSTHEDCQGTGYDMPLPLFSATYYDGADGRRHFSLRSPEGGADVGEIAKRMANTFNTVAIGHPPHGYEEHPMIAGPWTGGGHLRASGFDAPLGWEGE